MNLIRLQVALAAFFCMVSLSVFSQSKSNPIVSMLNYKMEPVGTGKGYSYIEHKWPEDGLWHVQLFYFPEKQLYADFFYKDSMRKERTGVYLQYYPNGIMSDSGFYVSNKKEDAYFTWYDNRKKKSFFHFKNGLPVDTCTTWNAEGHVIRQSITNEVGSGVVQQFYPNGKLRASGQIMEGVAEGNWQFKREDGTALMNVTFVKDSIVSKNCFDTLGQPLQGECIYERQASFPGGNDGWRQFLIQNFRYPSEARRNDISGTVKVKFQVDIDGSLSNFSIVSSPAQILSNEVLRLMEKSPRWQPAIQLNQPVKQYHIQNVSFYLE